MFQIPLYYRMLRLYASNNNLLKFYYSLYDRLDGGEEDLQKEQISNRIALRERFKLELSQYFDEKSLNNYSIIDSVFTSVLSGVIKLEFELLNSFSIRDWDSCHYFETRNVNHYYDILYSGKLSRSLTDLLLEQKGRVEGYLLREVY